MSAFDDEFGLFGEEHTEDDERRSTLGARTIASKETIIDEIEPEEERAPRRSANQQPYPRRREEQRAPLPDAIAHPRAVELLTFLVKKLVAKPEKVAVTLRPDDRGAVLALDVDPDDFGKVIGRGGRIAQALRTIVRAGAEGRVTIDITDAERAETGGAADAHETP